MVKVTLLRMVSKSHELAMPSRTEEVSGPPSLSAFIKKSFGNAEENVALQTSNRKYFILVITYNTAQNVEDFSLKHRYKQ